MEKYLKVLGTGSYFPSRIMTNKDFESMIDTTDEWIVSRTGIKERRIADENDTVITMGTKAAIKALEMSSERTGISIDKLKENIDGILVTTITPERVMPSTACEIQRELGIKNECFAVDLTAACSGFSYAVHFANSLIKSGLHKNILIVSAEKSSKVINWKDRNTCVIFGDGAGSMLVTASDKPGLYYSRIGAIGEHGELLTTCSSAFGDNPKPEAQLNMDGQATYKLAVTRMAELVIESVERSGLKQEDINYFVPHQANIRIIESAARRIGLPMDKVAINLDKYGNIISASILTALDGAIRSGAIKDGDNFIGTTFGGGITYGTFVMKF